MLLPACLALWWPRNINHHKISYLSEFTYKLQMLKHFRYIVLVLNQIIPRASLEHTLKIARHQQITSLPENRANTHHCGVIHNVIRQQC